MQDVIKHVASCNVCCVSKRDRARGKAETPARGSRPFEVTVIDILGPLPETEKGEKWVIGAVCNFTREAEVGVSCEAYTAESILEWLLTHLVPRWGTPRRIVTDRGSVLIAEVTKEWCEGSCTPVSCAADLCDCEEDKSGARASR